MQVLIAGCKITWNTSKEEAEEGKKELIEILKVLECDALGDGPYFGGEVFGLVDIAHVGFCMWFYTYEKCGDFSIEDECPKISQWAKRCWERESVCKSLAHSNRVYDLAMCHEARDLVMAFRKKLGLDSSSK